MEITINGKVYNVEKLDNGKWALPQEVKEALTITCSALNIDGNRVGYNMNDRNPATNPKYRFENGYKIPEKGQKSNGTSDFTSSKNEINLDGRYPAQTFIDSQVAERLDEQSGQSSGGKIVKNSEINRKERAEDASVFNSKSVGFKTQSNESITNYGDTGGCSKILHKCDYEQIDFDLFIYQPKVSKKERNAGLDTFEDLKFNSNVPIPQRAERPFNLIKNDHPTLKPIALNEKILRLFKTPNNQKICYPFAGAGSEIIGGIKAGFDNWTACELNQDYIDIANARIEYWTKQKNMVNDIKSTSKVNEVVEKGQVNLFDILSEIKKTKQESLF